MTSYLYNCYFIAISLLKLYVFFNDITTYSYIPNFIRTGTHQEQELVPSAPLWGLAHERAFPCIESGQVAQAHTAPHQAEKCKTRGHFLPHILHQHTCPSKPCAPWHHATINVAVAKPIGVIPNRRLEVRPVGHPSKARVASGAEMHDLDLKVPRPGRHAAGGAHHAVALGAGSSEAVVGDLDPLGLEEAGEEHRLSGRVVHY